MRYILEEKYGIEVELRRESFCINETASEAGEPHVFAYPQPDGSVSLEMSYDFLKRLLRYIDGSEELQEKLLAEQVDDDSD